MSVQLYIDFSNFAKGVHEHGRKLQLNVLVKLF